MAKSINERNVDRNAVMTKAELHGGRARISITSVDDQLLTNIKSHSSNNKTANSTLVSKCAIGQVDQSLQVNAKATPDDDGSYSHHASSSSNISCSSNQDKDGSWLSNPLKFSGKTLIRKVSSVISRLSIAYQGTIMSELNPNQLQVDTYGNQINGKRHSTDYSSSSSISSQSSRTKNHKSLPNILVHGKVPGVSGLLNHGNTCFMNAILQCLCSTDSLAKYFVLGEYKSDVRRRKKIKDLGTKGELTEHIATLLKSMWTCRYNAQLSSDFKSIVGKYCTLYRGCNQHDAQEFLLWLLNKIHEDLNRAAKRKYKTMKDSIGRPVEAVAAEVLANHNRCNDSFVYDLFQAYLRSSLTCPSCKEQSNTFDPYLCISLPLVQRDTRFVTATVIYSNLHKQGKRYGVDISPDVTIDNLCKSFSQQTNIPPNLMLVASVDCCGIRRILSNKDLVMDIDSNDTCYIIELPDVKHDRKSDQSINMPNAVNGKRHDSYHRANITVIAVNKRGSGQAAVRFGRPLAFRCSRGISYDELANTVLTKLSEMLHEKIDYKYNRDEPAFRLRLVNTTKDLGIIKEDDEYPLQSQVVDRALSVCRNCPSHIEIMVEWDKDMKTKIIGCVIEEKPLEDTVVTEKSCVASNITMYDCLKIYTQDEKLCEDSEWNCSACHKGQRGITKKLSMWTLPEIMIVHLKRFKQVGSRFTKLPDIVEFPITGLDMSDFVGRPYSADMHSYGKNQKDLKPTSGIYDLYAVCNHHGDMSFGHYTAYCRNPINGCWYLYDDTKVEEISSESIVTSAAYILFYAQRTEGRNLLYDSFGTSTVSHWTEKILSFYIDSSDNDTDDDQSSTDSQTEKHIDHVKPIECIEVAIDVSQKCETVSKDTVAITDSNCNDRTARSTCSNLVVKDLTSSVDASTTHSSDDLSETSNRTTIIETIV